MTGAQPWPSWLFTPPPPVAPEMVLFGFLLGMALASRGQASALPLSHTHRSVCYWQGTVADAPARWQPPVRICKGCAVLEGGCPRALHRYRPWEDQAPRTVLQDGRSCWMAPSLPTWPAACLLGSEQRTGFAAMAGPADGLLDFLDFPPQIPWCRVILWTDTGHTSAIKKRTTNHGRLIFSPSVER